MGAQRSCDGWADPGAAYQSLPAQAQLRVDQLLDCAQDEVFALCTALLQTGTESEVVGAILAAGALGIPPDSGEGLHGSLAIHAVEHLRGALSGDDRLVPVYYAAHALKFRQSSTGLIGDAAAPVARTTADALGLLDDALASQDADAADAAVVDLFAGTDTERAIEALLRWASFEQGHIGHLMIWFGLGIQALDAVGWSHAQPVLRSMVRDLATVDRGTLAELHGEAVARLEARSTPLGACGGDAAVTIELVEELRRKDPGGAADYVLALMEAGVSPDALWDGLAVSGAEDMVRGGSGYALHRFDTINALHHIYRRSQDTVTRQLTLVQAAAYACTLDAVTEVDLLTLDPVEVSGLDEVFDAPTDPEEAAARVLGFLEAGGSLDELIAYAEQLTVRRCHEVDEHSYKFPVAVIEETRWASEAWQPLAVAALTGQGNRSPAETHDEWDHYEEVLAEIASLG